MSKFSIDAHAVSLSDGQAVQFTVTLKVRNSKISTLMFTSDDNAEFERVVGHWFARRLVEQLDRQLSWYAQSDEHPVQLEFTIPG